LKCPRLIGPNMRQAIKYEVETERAYIEYGLKKVLILGSVVFFDQFIPIVKIKDPAASPRQIIRLWNFVCSWMLF